MDEDDLSIGTTSAYKLGRKHINAASTYDDERMKKAYAKCHSKYLHLIQLEFDYHMKIIRDNMARCSTQYEAGNQEATANCAESEFTGTLITFRRVVTKKTKKGRKNRK